MKKFLKVIGVLFCLFLVVAAVMLFMFFRYESDPYNRLSEDSKWFVNNFEKALDRFKKPESVEIKGIAYSAEENAWYIKVRARNSFDDYVTEYWAMYYDGETASDVLNLNETYYLIYYKESYFMNGELEDINAALHKE